MPAPGVISNVVVVWNSDSAEIGWGEPVDDVRLEIIEQ